MTMQTTAPSHFARAVARGLEGLEFVSTGACPGCGECGLAPETCEHCDGIGEADGITCHSCHGEGTIPVDRDDTHRIELASEPYFSWSACDVCGSHLGGDRHPAHGWLKRPGHADLLVHLDVCVDCLIYIANGDEPTDGPWGDNNYLNTP